MYSIENFIKTGVVPENIETEVSSFNDFFSTSIKYSLIEERELKFFLENKNGTSFFAFSLIDNVELVKDIPIREKINTNPFFETFSLNRTDILEQMFSNMLMKIENNFLLLKNATKSKIESVNDFTMFPATRYALLGNPNKDYSFQDLFKKAISSSINTRSLQNFVIIHKFLKENFSFVHGVFFKRNLNDFFGQKKALLRVKYSYIIPELGTNYKQTSYHYTSKIFNKKEIYNIIKLAFSYYLSYMKYKVSYLFFAFQRFFLNSISILRYIYYSINHSIKFKEIKRLTCSPEYRTDNVIKFRIKHNIAMSNSHPLELFNINYKDYSPERVELVFKLINSINYFPNYSFFKRLFLFVDTFDINDILNNIDTFFTKFLSFSNFIVLGYNPKNISFKDLSSNEIKKTSFLKDIHKEIELDTFKFVFRGSVNTALFIITRIDFLKLCIINKRGNLKSDLSIDIKNYIKKYRKCI